ncbi:MAG: glycosyltransferase family 2 protein [Candidatus Bathyarchaeia archaeon]
MVYSRNNTTIIVPALNESRSISRLLDELKQNGDNHIVVIDGNSVDGTAEVAEKSGATVILQRGSGKGAALRQAFTHSVVDGEIVVVMDADGSMDPKEVPLFISAIEEGADLVKGSRFLSWGRSEDLNLIRRIGNLFFLCLVNWLWSTKYTDLCYGFGAFRKNALKKLCPHLKSSDFEIETEICIKAKELGLNIVEVPSIEFKRRHGKSNLNIFRDGWKIIKTIFREFLQKYQ